MQPCSLCRTETDARPTTTGRVYCSPECKKAYFSKVASETMARTNRRYASERMRRRNPMHSPDVRRQLSQTHRARGIRPVSRGGNGTGPTVAQSRLVTALAADWQLELAIPTKQPRGSGYPRCYKADVGNSRLRVVVEIDGQSHSALVTRERDLRKEALLRSLGWTVLRFKNQRVLADLVGCVGEILEAAVPAEVAG